jgi:hypothetical protein
MLVFININSKHFMSLKRRRKIMNIINFLEYKSYAFNRSKNPEFEPELYSSLFEDWKIYEEKYQEEKVYWDYKARKEMEYGKN